MHSSVRALLYQVVDYAGLFPPAKLPLEEALRIYLHEKKSSPHRWMLGHFVCPIARLPELLTLAKAHPDRSLLSIAALGQQAASQDEFLNHLNGEISAIHDFHREWGQDRVIDLFEFVLPQGPETPPRDWSNAITNLAYARLDGYFEIPASATWENDVQITTVSLFEFRERTDIYSTIGLKLRCGGVKAEAFPSDRQIALLIDRCRISDVPWKATAGLHHPRRHWDANLNVWHHGFLNVFIAAVLADVHPLSEADIVAILADRDGAHFHFEEDSLGWKSWSSTTAKIAEARDYTAMSFGSCSFEEPCAELMAMGLLD